MFSLDYLHSQVIHFPIALLSVSVLFDLIGVYYNNNNLFSASWYVLILGSISSIAAVITGFIADQSLGHMSEPFPIFATHGSMQIITSLIFISLLIWRYINDRTDTKPPIWYIIIGMLAVGTLFYGGHLGAGLAGQY